MSAGSAIFCYDANGNQIQKIAGSSTNYAYDAENRMVSVSGAASATFVYDGDGNRVKGVVGGVTTTYIGNYFEWTPSGKPTLRVQAGSTSTMKQYYYTVRRVRSVFERTAHQPAAQQTLPHSPNPSFPHHSLARPQSSS